ncbi:Homeodomain-like superfamily protein [Perilla frutescens var. hirtella]|uniref:Homeodomain-like superfamily protein n=1 Tax=Perilla frutescens var. hirtella TaxID=608512 RepID=A0AAD4IP34_PERFH|nr:Homeodomain-like superfamily protein [Perilla frutescens var. hirtella]
MVSVYRNPPPNQDFSHFHGFYMGGDPMKMPPVNRDDSDLLPMAPAAIASSGVDDPSKKIRKPYTITKSRESWSEQEHDKFLEALQLFDRDWKKIEAFVGSKTVIQIRSHAQKYFLKVQKNGTSEHVPPPRPKRKAAHPYPQKASKNVVLRTTSPVQSSAARVETGYATMQDSFSIPRNPIGSAPLSSWSYNVGPTGCLPHVSKDEVGLANVANNYSSSSNDSAPRAWASNEMNHELKARQHTTTRVTPDFSQVYGFIGSIFDPTATNHLQRLRKLEPINAETVLMLMKNLCVNLVSPEFEDHRKLLSSYKVGSGNVRGGNEIPSA